MYSSTNLSVVSGNIGNVSDLRQTPSGKQVLDFSVAVEPRPRKDKAGKWINQEPVWIKVVVWNNTATYVAERAVKGRFVQVIGQIAKAETYKSKDGEIIAKSVINGREINFVDVQRSSVEAEDSYEGFDEDF
jgi:single-strand DNA-binding protein